MATTKNQTKNTSGPRFAKYEDIRNVLHAQTEAAVTEGLTALRNQLTIKHSEDVISAGDERLLLAKTWLERDNAARGLFDLWGTVNTRQVSLTALIVSVLSSLITLLSSHYTYHHLAAPVIRDILLPQWSNRLNTYLSTSHNELLLVTLKLYISISTFAGGKESRNVLDVFPWELKTLPKLLNMRRRSKTNDYVDALVKPDIRTLYVLFLLSFVDSRTPTIVKAAFLEQRRDNFASIFKGLSQDGYSVVRKVLETCWSGVWADVKIKRTVKVNIFNEHIIGQITRLYERTAEEEEGSESVPADLVHHFLLAICSRPGTGVCFRDQGWYPREEENDLDTLDTPEDAPRRYQGRIHNKILASVLKPLRVNEDARQQELALRILQACPELVAGYWPAVALTLEPRLSSKWIANIAFFGSVVSLPVPQTSFLLPDDSKLYRPSPPSLSTIMENILPSVNIKSHLSRGLQSPSALVQHCTALALGKCLTKYGAVLKSMREVQQALEEDEGNGLWSVRRSEVEREVLRRVPDFQVVVAFAQQKPAQVPMAVDGEVQDTTASTKAALLSESAQRLLWLYHRYLPQLVAEARFDVTRLLAGIHEGISDSDATVGLVTLRQLHTLRLLNETEEFSIMGKAGTTRGALNALFTLYTETNTKPIKLAVATLLKRSLSQTLLFQHDPHEVDLWLQSIPRSKRAPDAQAPDGTLLSDEVTAVISFLEDCIQRCAKTPYRYLEDLQVFWSQNSSPSLEGDTRDLSTFPSPLLITVLEQLEAKFTRNLLSPSDCLATVTYIRKLALRLAGKVQVLQPLHSLAKRLGALVDKPGPSSVMASINREAQYLSAGLKQLEFPTSVSDEHNTAADAFLKEVQAEQIPSSTSARYIRAYQLVDWYRLSAGSLDPVQFAALASVVETLAPAAVEDLLDYATFGGGQVWHYVNIATQPKQLDFGILFLHCDNDFVLAQANRRILVCSAFSDHPTAEDLKRAVGIVHHRLSYTTGALAVEGLIHILMELLERAFSEKVREATEIAHILWRLPTIASYARKALDPVVLPVFRDLVICSKRATTADENLLEDHIEFWSAKLMLDVSRLSDIEIETAIMWLQVMDHTRLLSLLDQLHFSAVTHEENSTTILAGILSALSKHLEVNYELPGLASRLPQLRDAASILQNSGPAKRILATAVRASLPLSYDGVVAESNSNKSLSSSVKIASEHWRAALDRTARQVDVERLVQQDNLTADDMTILAAAVYKSGSARAVIRHWLSAPSTANISAYDVAPVLNAYLDASLSTGDNIGEEDAFLCSLYVRAVSHVEDKIICQESSHIFDALLSLLPRLPPSMTEQIIASMSDSKAGPFAQVLSVLPSLPSSISDATRKSIGKLLARASKWIITTLSSDGPLSSRAHDVISATARTIKHFKSLSSSSAETLVISAVQYRLQEPSALSMVVGVLSSIDLKPATVNKILQSILQHPKFEVLGRVGESRQPEARSKLVTVLHTLFYLHPKNTCQPSHVQPLLALYGGTMSEIDRKILSIFKLFEVTRNASVASLLVHWSATVDPPSTTALEAVQSFDATRMLRTCLQFPQRINTGEEVSLTAGGEDIYDPWLVILLCSRMLSEGVPTTAPGWVQLFRTNVVGLLIRASSSHDDEVRNAAILQLNGLYTVLQDADFQEKPHVIYILDLLKDTYSKDTPADHAPRLPVYITLHLVHALRGIFYPSNFTYPLTARFVLQRPELDTNDMPLLYSMLYSVSDQWRKERAWIVRFMSDGMVGRQEWKVLRKRHIWDLLASMFHSEESDLQLRRSILELLANLTCERHAATSLVLGSALLSWIELQVERIRHDEGLAWVKILENILVVVDSSKMEASTSGEWRSSICRCLATLLQNPACGRSVFVYAVRVIQRISGLPTVSGAQLDSLVRFGVKHLAYLEDVLQAPTALSDPLEPAESIWAIAPHRSYGLWRSIEADELELWGQCVESLWSVVMRLEEKTSEWDALTARLLIWRAYIGPRCTVGEWARTEVIRNIRVD